MSNFYIHCDNSGNIVGHPDTIENLKVCYPSHDFESGPPSGWVVFERVDEPILGPYEKWDDDYKGAMNDSYPHNGLEYQFVDGKVKSVWHTVPLSDGEKDLKINAVKTYWTSTDGPNWSSWTFNETKCEWEPPTPRPIDGKIYEWNEGTTSWKEIE